LDHSKYGTDTLITYVLHVSRILTIELFNRKQFSAQFSAVKKLEFVHAKFRTLHHETGLSPYISLLPAMGGGRISSPINDTKQFGAGVTL
jgi:hypothetical protein